MLFVAYIAVMFIFALNIITGVLVNNVVETARDEKEMQREQRNRCLKDIRTLWQLMDPSQRGSLTRDQFHQALTLPLVQAGFDRLNLDLSDVSAFYDSLDADCDGIVEVEEFVVGLMQSHFKSNMVDAQTLLREHRKAKHHAAILARRTQDHLWHINRKMDRVTNQQQDLYVLMKGTVCDTDSDAGLRRTFFHSAPTCSNRNSEPGVSKKHDRTAGLETLGEANHYACL
uniref:EF-hand domain-containing protein n=1 Tax=Noctiluca scintillans TaxID=2966 RepID=A0A7S1AV62_NOCSC